MSDSEDSDGMRRSQMSSRTLSDSAASLITLVRSNSETSNAEGGAQQQGPTPSAHTPVVRRSGSSSPAVFAARSYFIFHGPRGSREDQSLATYGSVKRELIELSEALLATDRVREDTKQLPGYDKWRSRLNQLLPDSVNPSQEQREIETFYSSFHGCHVRYNAHQALVYKKRRANRLLTRVHRIQLNANGKRDVDLARERALDVRRKIVEQYPVLGFFCERLDKWYEEKLESDRPRS